jgi:predicted dehydrogenase
MARLRLGVIGVGHLGKEHARILSGMPEIELIGVADVNAEQARAVAARCGTRAFSDYRPLIGGVDAAVIAVPTTHHHKVACDCLEHGIPLLVEKPLALTLDQADELVTLARRKGCLLQVGHIERFNPAFEELQRQPLTPRFVSCQRLSPYTGRSADVGAVLDLMIHDLDLLRALVGSLVAHVEAVGATHLGGKEDVVTAQLVFANGCLAEVVASRVHPAPWRRMQVWGPEGHACIDFARRHLTLVQPCSPVAAGGGAPVRVREVEGSGEDQLTRELRDFIHSVQTGGRPRVSGEDGREAMALATRVLQRVAEAHGGREGKEASALPAAPGNVAA